MTPAPVLWALRRTLADIRYVTAVAPRDASGLVAEVYRRAEREFGMLAPPLALHSPDPAVLAASWLLLRETLLADGPAGRAAKEVVAAAVSLGNACPYCVEVHAATLGGLVAGPDATAVAEGRLAGITDPHLRALAVWAAAGGSAAGPVPHRTAAELPELVGVAFTFQYLNRMVRVFLADSPLPPQLPGRARRTALSVLGRLMRSAAGTALRPGGALDLLPPADPDPGLSAVAGDGPVAAALARASGAVEAAGRRELPAPVRELVHRELAAWDGRPRGISRGWVDPALSALPPAERPPARLALLTAMAAYQVDRTVVEEFRRDRPGDRALVTVTAWASLAAAHHVTGTARREKTAAPAPTDDRRVGSAAGPDEHRDAHTT